jgi:hypothetical protein
VVAKRPVTNCHVHAEFCRARVMEAKRIQPYLDRIVASLTEISEDPTFRASSEAVCSEVI